MLSGESGDLGVSLSYYYRQLESEIIYQLLVGLEITEEEFANVVPPDDVLDFTKDVYGLIPDIRREWFPDDPDAEDENGFTWNMIANERYELERTIPRLVELFSLSGRRVTPENVVSHLRMIVNI